MRLGMVLLVVLIAACGQPAPAPAETAADASAGSSGAGRVAGDAPALLEPISLIGTWSFDRSCASGDGMRLEANGAASFDEWGEGMWALDADHRLVLVLRRHEMGVADDGLGERLVYVFTPSAPAGDDLAGGFTSSPAAWPAPAAVNAKRCPG